MDHPFDFGALRNIAEVAPGPEKRVLLHGRSSSDCCDSRADQAYLVLSREFVSVFPVLRGSSEASDG